MLALRSSFLEYEAECGEKDLAAKQIETVSSKSSSGSSYERAI